jgi:anti-anti-sigma regulatory factor
MPVTIDLIPSEDRLDISFEGNLDVIVWQDVCDACVRTSEKVKACIVDLTGVKRFFDSGIAILGLLYERMSRVGATVIFLSDDPSLKERMTIVASPRWHPPSPLT